MTPRVRSLSLSLSLLLLPLAARAADAPSNPALGTPMEHSAEDSLELAGDLRPVQATELSFKAGGQLAAVRVTRGEHVKKGQVIAALSDAEARAQFAQAQAGVAAAEAQAGLAEDAEKRTAQLAESDAAPGMQKVGAKLQADAARAGLAAAKAQLALAQANLDNHTLRAPFDGTVVRVPDGVGATVGPGMPIARLEKLDVLVMQASAGERDLDRLKVNQDMVVTTASGREVPGRVRALVRSLDGASRRAPVEIEVANTDGSLVAGAYVRARPRVPLASSTPH